MALILRSNKLMVRLSIWILALTAELLLLQFY